MGELTYLEYLCASLPETQVKTIKDVPNNYGPFLPGMGYGHQQRAVFDKSTARRSTATKWP